MIAGGVDDPPSGPTADLGGLPAALSVVLVNPLVVWLVSAAGGTMLYLGLLRRPTDDNASLGEMTLATATPIGQGQSRARQALATPAVVVAAAGSGSTAAARPAEFRRFDAPPAGHVERAVVGYHKVRISSKPDAVLSTEIGRLQRGDEVEIVDSYAGFLQVRTPDGLIGWVQRHTIISASSVSGA